MGGVKDLQIERQEEKYRHVLLRFWHEDYSPREALHWSNSSTDYEVSTDTGKSWRAGTAGQTLADVSEWMADNNWVVQSVNDPVNQRNGRSGWRGEFILVLTKMKCPEQPVTDYIKEALDIPHHTSDPLVGEDGREWEGGGMDVKPHGTPDGMPSFYVPGFLAKCAERIRARGGW